MNIVADENIPYAREAFSGLGNVTLTHGRDLPSLDYVDALIVRSITKVNEALLKGTNVKFVGTATIGFDHIDRDYLDANGIAFSSAPGSNSNSVSEYITASLLVYAKEQGIELAGKSIAVIGVGNVGSKVVQKCETLGMTVYKNDPPLADKTGDPSFLPLEDVLHADFVTFHVPLTKEGPYPTWHMANEKSLSRMNGVLFNSSRGSVVDEIALKAALGKTVKAAMLDVWEHEPMPDPELAARVSGGTPHIAGYSFDGKVNGTQMMYDAVCLKFGIESTWNAKDELPSGSSIECSGESDEDVIRDAVLKAYDIRRDHSDFKAHMDEFDRLRKEYPRRREFQTFTVQTDASESVKRKLEGLGFNVL